MKNIPYLDLKRQYDQIKKEVDNAIAEVVNDQIFILGDKLINFEKNYASYLRLNFCIGLNSGTDALIIGLLAIGIKPGDEIITSPFSFIATTLAITEVGAKPIFVDINSDTYQIDENKIEKAITKKTKAILPVHIYGAPCQIDKIVEIGKKYNLSVIEDACQAHGAKLNGKKLGTFGELGTFSFYPGKNLGAYGDGGVVSTDDSTLAEEIKMIRNYGQKVKYYHEKIGVNSRLDEIQAAILDVKLKYLDAWNDRRRAIAEIYRKGIKGMKFQKIIDGGESCYHIFTIETDRRQELIEYLKESGVPTLVHYPIPIHLQKCYDFLGYSKGSFPNTEKICETVLSLPIYSELTDTEAKRISSLINKFNKQIN